MQVLAAVSFAATLVAGLAAGGRLLALAHATRQTEELFLGLGVVLLAAASTLEVAAMELARPGVGAAGAYPLEVVALFLHSASSSSLCFAVWRIFHPDRPWALRLCLAETALLFTSWQAVILLSEHTSVTGFTPWFHLHVASRGAAFAWGTISGTAYYRRLRRRRNLGLADAFLCHRFLLWTVGMACTTGILATALFTNLTQGVLVYAWPPALLLVSLLGLPAAGALWLAFLPPPSYERLIRSWDARLPTGDPAPR
jgi:hypothetical protein